LNNSNRAGKRKCPGEGLAWRLLFRGVCGVLKDYDLRPADPTSSSTAVDKTYPYISVPKHVRMAVQTRADKPTSQKWVGKA
jgi:hypothetical protein